MWRQLDDVPDEVWEDTEFRAEVLGEDGRGSRPLRMEDGSFSTSLEDEWPVFETILGELYG